MIDKVYIDDSLESRVNRESVAEFKKREFDPHDYHASVDIHEFTGNDIQALLDNDSIQ